jgi:adenylate kinase family enzyme
VSARRIHLTGASGAGVTTVGRAVATRLGLTHLDTDDFYWLPTKPPFRDKRPIAERLALLRRAFEATSRGWVLSGSIGAWGDELIPLFDLVAFIDTPTELRLKRLARREAERYGAAIEPGGPRRQDYLAFMDWASRYEHGDRGGRSRGFHEAWLAALPCPVLRLDGSRSAEALAAQIAEALEA